MQRAHEPHRPSDECKRPSGEPWICGRPLKEFSMIERTIAAAAKGILRVSTGISAVLAYAQLLLSALVFLAILGLVGIMLWQWIA